MTIFLRIVAVILILAGLLAGGCSLIFTTTILGYGDLGITPIWLAGFGVAALLIWGGIALWRGRD